MGGCLWVFLPHSNDLGLQKHCLLIILGFSAALEAFRLTIEPWKSNAQACVSVGILPQGAGEIQTNKLRIKAWNAKTVVYVLVLLWGLIVQLWKVNHDRNNFLLHLNAGQVGSRLRQCYNVCATRCYISYVCLHVFDLPAQCILSNDLTLCCVTKRAKTNCLVESLCNRISCWAKAVGLLKWVEKLELLQQCYCQCGSRLRLRFSIQNWNVLYQNGLYGECFSAMALQLTESYEGRDVFRFF